MRKNSQDIHMSVFRQIREKTGMSQAELADYLNITIATLSRWENGKHQPALTLKQIKTLSLLLRGMGLNITDLPDDAFLPIKNLVSVDN